MRALEPHSCHLVRTLGVCICLMTRAFERRTCRARASYMPGHWQLRRRVLPRGHRAHERLRCVRPERQRRQVRARPGFACAFWWLYAQFQSRMGGGGRYGGGGAVVGAASYGATAVVSVLNSVLAGNSATRSGGALYVAGDAVVSIVSSVVSSNTAVRGRGAVQRKPNKQSKTVVLVIGGSRVRVNVCVCGDAGSERGRDRALRLRDALRERHVLRLERGARGARPGRRRVRAFGVDGFSLCSSVLARVTPLARFYCV